MTTRFYLKVNTEEAIEVERWLYQNIGPQVKEVIPKKNIKIMNWESRFQFDANWNTRKLMVEITDDSNAVAFKLTWNDQIHQNKTVIVS